jgi:hypothetical protein
LFGVELLADGLEARPLVTCRLQRWEANAGEPVIVGEVSDVWQRDLPAPEVAGEYLMGRQGSFCEVAVPLSPRRFLAVGEIDGLDNRAALPSVVSRVGWLVEDVGASRHMPEPGPGDRRRVDVEQR